MGVKLRLQSYGSAKIGSAKVGFAKVFSAKVGSAKVSFTCSVCRQ